MNDKKLEDKILMEIAKAYPFSFDDVRAFYDTVKSFDTTIQACESACELGFTDLMKVLELVKDGLPEKVKYLEFPKNFLKRNNK